MTGPDPARCPPEAARYFRDYAAGRFDDFAQLGFIYPVAEARLAEDGSALFVGRAGADGIEFADRAGESSIWAFYPIEAEWRRVAPDIETLERDWMSRVLKV